MVDPSGLKGLFKKLVGLVVAVVVFVAAVSSVVTGGASLIAVAGAIGAGLALVSSALDVASTAIGIVDEKRGWDRSDTVKKLGIASNVFGKAGAAVSMGASVGTGVKAGRGVGKKYTLGDEVKPGRVSSRAGRKIVKGVKEGVKAQLGLDSTLGTVIFVGKVNVKVTEKLVEVAQPQNATDGSNGSGQGEVDLSTTSGRAGAGGEAGGSPFQPSFDPMWDSIASLNNASEEYDQVAKSVRQPINSQLYYGES
jgi:hypothetical protein